MVNNVVVALVCTNAVGTVGFEELDFFFNIINPAVLKVCPHIKAPAVGVVDVKPFC